MTMSLASIPDVARHRVTAVARWLSALLLVAIVSMLASAPAAAQAVNRYTNTTDSSTNGLNENTAPCFNPFTRTFSVSDNFIVTDVQIGVLLAHTYRGDLLMWLRAPDGTRIQLTNGSGTFRNNYNVLFDDAAGSGISNYTVGATASPTTTVPPYENSYQPTSSLSGFSGKSSAGTWTLEICDQYNQDSGTFYQADLFLTQALTNYADLSVNKQVSNASPANGSSITYTITVANSAASPDLASGVEVTDLLPLGTTYVGHSGPGSYNSTTGVWQVGSLAPGASATLTIQATVNATAGAVITNTAEITASSQVDSDSTVANGVTSEDDYDSATITISGTRTAGIPPVLSCPRGSSVFDWDTRSWPAGSLSQSYTLTNVGTLDFSISSTGTWVNDPAFGGQTPVLGTANTGGLPTAELSLSQYLDFANINQTATTVLTLDTAVPGVQFTVFDVDFAANDFADKMTVIGTYRGATVYPTLTNGLVNYVIGNTAIGDSGSSGTQSNGNVVVTFTQPVDSITIVYGNHTTAPSVPDGQAISIHDITFCNPYADITVAKVSSVISDPVNGTTDPRAIPGALVQYLITVANNGVSPTNTDSVVITDDGPDNAKICFDTNGSGQPVVFTDGSPGSGLTLGYVALGDGGDSLEFSSDGGASWNHVPVPDADGCDASVTHFRLTPSGQFQAGSSFTIRTSYRIE